MKRLKKIGAVVALIALCAAPVCADTPSLAALQNGVKDFSASLAKTLPFNASIGLNWSDAYIGQLLSMPPHFGVGVSGGVTTMDMDAFQGLLDAFNIPLPLDTNKMILPAYTVEGRIGGFILPFDLGVKFGALPPVTYSNMDMNYLLVGGSLRYAVLKGGVILPKISVGLGVNYLKGGIATTIEGVGTKFDVPGGDELVLSDPKVSLEWSTLALDVTAQVSKSLFIITPYLGVGASYAKSKAGYRAESSLTYGGNALDQAAIDTIKGSVSGLDDLDASGFSSIIEDTGFSFRAFGGLSLNLAVIKLDFTGMLNFRDMNFGGTFGVRFQL
ncbi:MAG: hypothetical protein LBS86_03800 [Treponema sp.]|jgi:hypothetical protein|nr:hypothetical protein [Treponema sp.]